LNERLPVAAHIFDRSDVRARNGVATGRDHVMHLPIDHATDDI
jgi:hypothetical protein